MPDRNDVKNYFLQVQRLRQWCVDEEVEHPWKGVLCGGFPTHNGCAKRKKEKKKK